MLWLRYLAIVAVLAVSAPAVADRPRPASDALSRMFLWWNQAIKTPGALTPANFARYFTPDATLVVDGKTVVRGVDEWATHFQRIQAKGGDVEIVVPFKTVIQQGDVIYSYHVIRSRRGGKAFCMLAAGHATLRQGKISSVVLVRHELDRATEPFDPECWTT